jgi:hypothetical protein
LLAANKYRSEKEYDKINSQIHSEAKILKVPQTPKGGSLALTPPNRAGWEGNFSLRIKKLPKKMVHHIVYFCYFDDVYVEILLRDFAIF